MCLIRRYLTSLEKHFVVVSWDQRGAGKSFSALHPESSMTIKQFIYDTYELAQLLCRRFNQPRIFLAGHSWGSGLGMLTVQRYPELFHAYIGIGQIADMSQNELISYNYTLEQAQKANDRSVVKKLIEIGRPPYTGNWRLKFATQRRYLGKYRGEYYSSTKGALPVYLGSLIRSTEYNLQDKINFFGGILNTVRLIGPELMTLSLRERIQELKVPVYFMLGRHDREVPSFLAEQYFNELKAPSKELFWFEHSAHLPQIEERDRFCDLLIHHVLKISGAVVSES
jgi:pimeloyl-ACP methyl ester carboxylesterase